jgi:hypothetical protein
MPNVLTAVIVGVWLLLYLKTDAGLVGATLLTFGGLIALLFSGFVTLGALWDLSTSQLLPESIPWGTLS